MQIKFIETGEVISLIEFYVRNPRVQLPQPPTDEALSSFGAHLVPAPEPVPASCTKRQGELALLTRPKEVDGQQLTVLHWVEYQIDTEQDPIEKRRMQAEFNAAQWDFANPFLQQTWLAAGGTLEELEDLFRLAVTL